MMKIESWVFKKFEENLVKIIKENNVPLDGSVIIYPDDTLYKHKRCGYFAWYEKNGVEIAFADDIIYYPLIHPKDFQPVVDYLAEKYNFSTEFVCRRSHEPNKETKKVLENFDSGLDKDEVKHYSTVEEMFKDMGLAP